MRHYNHSGSLKFWTALVTLLATVSSEAGPWRFSNPRPHGSTVLDMAMHGGAVYQFGERGQIYRSENLDDWQPIESGTRNSLRAVTIFGGMLYASGAEGTIVSGTGKHFVAQTLGTGDWLEGIAASPSIIVAVGDNGAIFTSADGKAWTKRGEYTHWLRSVAYGGGRFVAVGEDGFLAESQDGMVWERRSVPVTTHLNKVSYLNETFWILGEGGVALTNNFRTYLPLSLGVTNDLYTASANGGEIILAGDQIVLRGDLHSGTWTRQSDATTYGVAPLWPYYSSLWDGRLFLLGGRTGLTVEGYRTNATAPLNWYSTVQPTRSWLWSVTRVPDFYAAVGTEGAILTSSDGLIWEREVVPQAHRTSILLGIGGNTNVLVAAGSGGALLFSPNTVTNVVQTDASGLRVTNEISLFGLQWNAATSGSVNDLQGVAASENRLVVTGAKGTILTSADGATWRAQSSGTTNYLSSVARWPGGFIAVGDRGTILSSADGSSWGKRNSGTERWVYSVKYLNGRLVAVGEAGLILTSHDGAIWSPAVSSVSAWLNDVTWIDGRFFVFGTGGIMLTSVDGLQWSNGKTSSAKSLYSAATHNGQLVAVGLEGVILRKQIAAQSSSVEVLDYRKSGRNHFFLLQGRPDQAFTLQRADKLGQRWTDFEHLEVLSPAGLTIYQTEQDDASSRFFRTKLLSLD